MNAKPKRRAAVPKAARQEAAIEAGAEESPGAAEGRQEAAAGFAPGSLVLSKAIPWGRFERLEIPCGEYLPCNPSVAVSENGRCAYIVRTVNYLLGEEDGIWFRGESAPNTVNYFGFLDDPESVVRIDDGEVRSSRVPARNGLEDARLFWWRGKWHFTATALHHGPRVRGTMALCELDGHKVSSIEFLHSPHSRELEKNWMPCVKDGALMVVYSHHPAEVLQVKPLRQREWIGDFAPLAGWSGGSQLIPYEDGYIGIVHQRRKFRNRVYYVHKAVKYDTRCQPIHVGRDFYFFDEQIEFCAGLAYHGSKYILSFGVKDREAWVVRLEPAELAALLASE